MLMNAMKLGAGLVMFGFFGLLATGFAFALYCVGAALVGIAAG